LLSIGDVEYDYIVDPTPGIDACGELNVSGTYTLTQDVFSSKGCFNVSVANIILDCAGYNIVYGNISVGIGVQTTSAGTNFTIKNCNITKGNRTIGVNTAHDSNYAINISANNATIFNNTISTWGSDNNIGIYLNGAASEANITQNRITANGYGATQYGIYLSGQGPNNTIIQDNIIRTNNTLSTADNDYGIYLSSVANNQVINNTIHADGRDQTNYGILLSGSSSNTISQNRVWTNGSALNHGIYLTTLSNSNNFTDNQLITNGSSSSNYGIYLSSASSTKNRFVNNTIYTGGSGGSNIGIKLMSANNTFQNNTIITSIGTLCHGIHIYTSSYGNVIDNNIITAGGTSGNGIYLEDSDRTNNITNNNITQTSNRGIYLYTSNVNMYPSNRNLFTGNIFERVASEQIYLDINVHNNFFINQSATNVTIINSSGLTFGNDIFGRITFINNISFARNNTDAIIRILNNSASVFVNNSKISGVNVTSNVTLYGLRRNYTNPGIFVDGTDCINCINYTSLNAGTVVFKVPSWGIGTNNWTNYSIQETTRVIGATACGDLNSAGTTYNLTSDVSSPGTCFNVSVANVVLDCAGYTITYGNISVGVGVQTTSGGTNLTIKNCNITKGNRTIGTVTTHNKNYGIDINGAHNATIFNNSISTFGSNDNYGVYIRGAEDSNLSNNIITTNGYGSSERGVSVSLSNNTKIEYNIIRTNNTLSSGQLNYGVFVNQSSNNNIYENLIHADGRSQQNHGINISISSSNTISNNRIWTNGSAQNFGLTINSKSNYNNITNNKIITNGSTYNFGIDISYSNNNTIINNTIYADGRGTTNSGIFFSNILNTLISNNTIHTSGTTLCHGIYSSQIFSQGNTIDGNIITAGGTSGDGMYLDGKFTNNNITNNNLTASSNMGINMINVASSFNKTIFSKNVFGRNIPKEQFYLFFPRELSFINQSITNITISNAVITTFGNDIFGKITFINSISFTKNNTDAIIQIRNNSASVYANNSKISGINVTSNVTLYNLAQNFTAPIILKDGYPCGSSCTNFTGLNTGTVVFNITSWTGANNWANYSIGENDTTPPNVTLNTPANLTITNETWFNFTANISDVGTGVKNATLFIYNETGLYNSTVMTFAAGVLSRMVGIQVLLVEGVYTWFYQAFDWVGNLGTSDETSANFTITVNTEYPQFSNSIRNPANNSEYSPNAKYEFNITITNTNGTAGIEFNGTNYTMTNIGDVYNLTLVNLRAGYYEYYFWAKGNGANTLYNVSNVYSYTIAKNSSALVNLTLNNTQGNFSLGVNETTDLNCSQIYGDIGNVITLYNNGTLINSGVSPLYNLTNFTETALYNITCIYPASQNYTQFIETYWVNTANVPIAYSISLSSLLANQIKWNVASLPIFNQSADGNNGENNSEYFVNVSVTGGTVDLYVKASGNLMTPGEDVLGLGNETYSYNINYANVSSVVKYPLSLNYADNKIGDGLTNGEAVYLKFFLSAPSRQSAGTYNNTLLFKAVEHNQAP